MTAGAAPIRDRTHDGPGRPCRRWPRTLLLGLALILACEAFLFIDVANRGGAVIPTPDGRPLPRPSGTLGWVARWFAVNITALCWLSYLFLLDGLLTKLAWRRGERSISPLRARPNRFVVAWLTSVPVWCFFDWVNFYYIDAWRYHGLPRGPLWSTRLIGYLIAFAAITPGMLLAAQLFEHLGLARLRTAGIRIARPLQIAACLLGLAFLTFPFIVREPVATLTLWLSLMFLLDPINYWLGAPSLTGDWIAGRWGRTVSLMAGGLLCGLLWEFWNYWALAKWTYHLPFLGAWEQVRYFEMPLIGMLGFLPFALECWVVFNTFLALGARLGLRLAEPLPDEHAVL